MPDIDSWTVVVPAKRSEVAKSRLEPVLGHWRVRLARAFALDTIAAVRSCTMVDRLVVVSDGPGLHAELEKLGAYVVQDPSHGTDMNDAVMAGVCAARATEDSRVAVIPADLPALRPEELSAALRRAASEALSAVSDPEGVGTTMLASTRPRKLVPHFGPGSFSRHLRDGAHPLSAGPGLVRDIDLPEHLEQAIAHGVGPRTAALIDQAGLA